MASGYEKSHDYGGRPLGPIATCIVIACCIIGWTAQLTLVGYGLYSLAAWLLG